MTRTPKFALALLLLVFGAGSLGAAPKSFANPHGKLKEGCDSCHSLDAWKPLRQPLPFQHGTTGFPLLGEHSKASCVSCHAGLVFAGAKRECVACHERNFTRASAPDHLGFPTTCQDCHGVSGWKPATFDHQRTAFPLQGAHRAADCQACHAQRFAGTPTECMACHQRDFNAATKPKHDGFPTTCTDCHGVSAWQPAKFDHNRTGFVLNGAHRSADCSSCHRNGYAGTPSTCASCHQADFDGAKNPSHAGFPSTCQDCHGESAWQPARFDHNATGFPLNGAHRTATCQACHRNGYAGTPSTCASCHQADFAAAKNPSHAGFPTTCQDCHAVTAWQPASFDHNATGFPLNGAHRSTSCTSCHRNGYAGTPTECFACHQSDYTGAKNPSHSGFPTTCQNCHAVTAWQPASFDHNATGFPLSGAHRSATCLSCHRNGYAGTPKECFACHQSDYTGAKNPSHSGFPTTCQNCHGVAAWQPASFDHNATGFPLNGAHRSATCLSCHRNGYAGTPKECVSCHQSDYNGARNPNHTGFPTTCQDCHGVSAWQPASFNHSATGFPLSGAHQAVACLECHRNGYAGTPKECFACHQSDYNGARNPSHTGFPTTCQNCHGVAAWQPASFDHNTTGFPLTGAHRNTACTACHRNGYPGTPSECFACHQSDYNGARNPNHTGFPTTCQNCHGTSAWEPASFNHESFFPIASGNHQFGCSSCHVNAGNYAVFECIRCHEHSQSETDRHHRGVGGYSYDSQACFRCHPRGRE